MMHYWLGYLSAPDVDYTNVGDGSIQFSWSPPFSHNITDVEPDISYYLVNVYRDDLPEYTVTTTQTQYTVQTGNCAINKYHVEVAAVNVVGVGEKYTSPYFVAKGSFSSLIAMKNVTNTVYSTKEYFQL